MRCKGSTFCSTSQRKPTIIYTFFTAIKLYFKKMELQDTLMSRRFHFGVPTVLPGFPTVPPWYPVVQRLVDAPDSMGKAH